jgi:hypothetical protein
MRTIIAGGLLLTGMLASIGCAPMPKYPDVAAKLAAPAPGQGRIFFYRDGMPVGMGVQPDITLNGQVVGKSVPNGFCYVDRPAGSYEVRTATEAEHKLNFALAGGEEKYVKTYVTMGLFIGQVHPELANRDDALKVLKDTSWSGAAPP